MQKPFYFLLSLVMNEGKIVLFIIISHVPLNDDKKALY